MKNITALTLESYKEFLQENNLSHNKDNIEDYISFIYWDLRDELESACEDFHVPKDLEGIQAQEYIEQQIRAILLNSNL